MLHCSFCRRKSNEVLNIIVPNLVHHWVLCFLLGRAARVWDVLVMYNLPVILMLRIAWGGHQRHSPLGSLLTNWDSGTQLLNLFCVFLYISMPSSISLQICYRKCLQSTHLRFSASQHVIFRHSTTITLHLRCSLAAYLVYFMHMSFNYWNSFLLRGRDGLGWLKYPARYIGAINRNI